MSYFSTTIAATAIETAKAFLQVAKDIRDDIHKIAKGEAPPDATVSGMEPEELKAKLENITKALADGDYEELDIKAMLREQSDGARLVHIIVKKQKKRSEPTMSKKKNCRRTPAEQAIHEEAVRLRRMTDKQLVEQFHRAAEPEMAASSPSVAQDGAEAAGPIGNPSAVQVLLTALAEGKCKGIKSGIAYKVAQLAAEMGLA